MCRFKFRLWNCLSYPQDSETAGLHKVIKLSGHSAMLWLLFVLLYFNCHLSAPTLPKPHYPFAQHNVLASLVKGELLLLSNPQPTIEGSSHQHRRKHFPHRQVVNIFVSISVQLHWHWPFKKTPLTWDICTNMRTCSVKRPCIDRIYNVQVVLWVPPTPPTVSYTHLTLPTN